MLKFQLKVEGCLPFAVQTKRRYAKIAVTVTSCESHLKAKAKVEFKGELRNRFNLISDERVKKFEQNSENLMKIG